MFRIRNEGEEERRLMIRTLSRFRSSSSFKDSLGTPPGDVSGFPRDLGGGGAGAGGGGGGGGMRKGAIG